jgi:hypothetical protein
MSPAKKQMFKEGDVVQCVVIPHHYLPRKIKGEVVHAGYVKLVPVVDWNYVIKTSSGKTFTVFQPDYDIELCKINSKDCDKCKLRFKCFTNPKK